MNQEDDYNKQYTRIAAAEDLVEQNSLMQDYIVLYKKKFRGEPLVDVGRTHIAQIKHLKNTAKEKAHALLHHYFQMQDPWFIQQAYSLDCLIKNLHKVHASFSQRTTAHRDSSNVKMEIFCDACWKEFTYVCSMQYDFLNKTVRCEECERENKPVKKVSKEQRRATILKLGAVFPGLTPDA